MAPPFDLLLILSGPLAVGAVTGAWISVGRLFLTRAGGPRLPRSLPWVLAGFMVLGALVGLMAQLVTLTGGLKEGLPPSPAEEHVAAAVTALLLSPAWSGSAALAALGTLLHYALDDLLIRLQVGDARGTLFEGLALGLRGVWLVVGLLALGAGLTVSYNSVMGHFRATIDLILMQAGLHRLLLNVLAMLLALVTLIVPVLMERQPPRPAPPPPQ